MPRSCHSFNLAGDGLRDFLDPRTADELPSRRRDRRRNRRRQKALGAEAGSG